MANFPAPNLRQVNSSRSWTELYQALGLNPRNSRACKSVQTYVQANFPSSSLIKERRRGTVNDTEFATLVMESTSAREIMIKAGWTVCGSAYSMVWKRIDRLSLDTSHFLGRGHSAGKKAHNRRDIREYLIKDCYSISSHMLKLRLIKEGIKEHRCERCNLTEWEGQPIPITLDHINGDHHDNTLSNLRILCPNCHHQTSTFGARNRKALRQKRMERNSILQSNGACGENRTRTPLGESGPEPDVSTVPPHRHYLST